MKPDADFANRPRRSAPGETRSALPSASRISALPHWLEKRSIAVFRDLDARARNDKSSHSRDVERAGAVATRPAGVQQRLAGHAGIDLHRLRPAWPARTPPVPRRSLPSSASATRKAAICAVVASSAENQFHHRSAPRQSQVLAVCRLVKVRDQRHAIVNAWLPCQPNTRSAPPAELSTI